MNNPFEMYYNWLLYGELVKFGVFANVFLDQVAGNMAWIM